MARSAGKQVGISEAWLFKAREAELDALDDRAIFARDAFSFLTPLDAYSLRVNHGEIGEIREE